MEKRALSILSRGGSGGDRKPKNALSIHIINHHRFVDSVIGGHSYDYFAEEKCNADDLLGIVKNILLGATQLVDEDSFPKKDLPEAPPIILPSEISHQIDLIYCEMTCQDRQRENIAERYRAIFQELRSYRWTTQLLLVLAAFALQYGDFWQASKAPPEGFASLSKALNSLKKKVISDGNDAAINPLNKVVNHLCELTTSLFRLTELVNDHPEKHLPELAKAFRSTPRWSCETIIAVLDAWNIFAQIIGFRTMFTQSELENLESSVLDRKKAVLESVAACKEQIGSMEKYQKYVKKVKAPVDIADFLRSLLADDPKQNPFVPPVKYELFRKKIVLLIISGQKISEFDIATLESIHKGRQESPKGGIVPIQMEDESQKKKVEETVTFSETRYELVWIPIVDAGHDKLEKLPSFESVRPWAFVVDPRKMNKFAGRYIKEEWHFKGETMVVVLDSLGWVENTNAMPMLRIRETDAFPYTENEIIDLWKGPNWAQLVFREPVVKDGTLAATETEYRLFYGGTAATKPEADVASGVPNLSVVPIENTKRFFILLRSCLICMLQALHIQDIEKDQWRDRLLFEMHEAYEAFRRGGVAILTKGPDLQVQHVGLWSDLKMVRDQVVKDAGKALAEGFQKKFADARGQCLHVCVPYCTDLEDLHCPVCGQLMGYDLCLTCCHSDSD